MQIPKRKFGDEVFPEAFFSWFLMLDSVSMKYRKQNHSVYYCEYNFVFATKYRRKIFNNGIFVYMKDRLKQVKELSWD